MTNKEIDLSGDWLFALDLQNKGIAEEWYASKLEDIVKLPGTTDENNKGIKNIYSKETDRLTRLYPYEGKAWYQKEIEVPNNYQGENVFLVLERTKSTQVWFDTTYIGHNNTLLSQQTYDLTNVISPGKHLISILVDNGNEAILEKIKGSHALTEHTQTNWNGIIGRIYLDIRPAIYISSIQTFPNIEEKNVTVHVTINNNRAMDINGELSLQASICNEENPDYIKKQDYSIFVTQGTHTYTFQYPMGRHPLLWSEFEPNLYQLQTVFTTALGSDTQTTLFGMRHFSTQNTHFCINQTNTFLRGKQDACVFPITGYPPMSVDKWRKTFKKAKEYGINHYRFHTWTPPEAAFIAADLEGIYIQAELPFWGWMHESDYALNKLLYNEGIHILEKYGNHPSFTMFSLGNELSGDDRIMREFVDHFRKLDNRHLYTFGSNNYLGSHGREEGEDYMVTTRVGRDIDSSTHTHVRTSFSFADAKEGGSLNSKYPSTTNTYEEAIAYCPVPVVSHETGQFQVYPNYQEIKKYTGILHPYNLQIYQQRLWEHHLPEMADKFQKASGRFALLCYKADIETALRTKGFGGYQMANLQDYPGQGTALIGMLDAFMEEKGFTTGEEFRQFSNQIVPLASFPKYCWRNHETFQSNLFVANYSPNELTQCDLICQVLDKNGEVITQSNVSNTVKQGDVYKVGSIEIPLEKLPAPSQITLQLSIEGTPYHNQYTLWIYPDEYKALDTSRLYITQKLDKELTQMLKKGKTVIYNPLLEENNNNSLKGMFSPDYWSYHMFKEISENTNRDVSPGTLSLFMNPEHPLFKQFPTQSHTGFQWWSIIKASRPFILDCMPANYTPVVQVIDNIQRAHKLGILFEFKVGKGKLLVSTTRFDQIKNTPEGQQYYHAILKYALSDKFKPTTQLTEEELLTLSMNDKN